MVIRFILIVSLVLVAIDSIGQTGENVLHREYYESGKVKFEVSLVDGQKEGIGVTFLEDGTVNIRAEYKNDELNGLFVQQYHGIVFKEVHYKDGQLNGYAKYWDSKGQILREGTFINGKENGVCKEYDKRGCLNFEYTYLDGEKEGPFKHYYCEGLRTLGSWHNGVPHGDWVSFNMKGDTVCVTHNYMKDGEHYSEEDLSYVEGAKPSFTIEKEDGKTYIWQQGLREEVKTVR